MDTLLVNEFRKQVGEYLNQTYYAGKAFTLMKGNRPMAALVPMSLLERLTQLEDQLASQVLAADPQADPSIDAPTN
ncbi:type II toxin-antitoxin system Phd/YefM family antitoxin (plasmid) [Spirosoma rhododendri]|uniref:Antitoxin n=1 Tax=Spirosoma rhododendri TaxID=2728024 RepID=A0A7L5DYL2_9BACT|nr:type II toxin-antitoxin system Phd/YefM family antitoxin [Spirosoma rhododendri]